MAGRKKRNTKININININEFQAQIPIIEDKKNQRHKNKGGKNFVLFALVGYIIFDNINPLDVVESILKNWDVLEPLIGVLELIFFLVKLILRIH